MNLESLEKMKAKNLNVNNMSREPQNGIEFEASLILTKDKRMETMQETIKILQENCRVLQETINKQSETIKILTNEITL